MCSKNFAKFTEKQQCWSLLIEKETPTQVFSCKFCGISKNAFSYRTSPVVASVILLSWLWNHVQSQQQKSKVRFVGSLRVGMAGGSGKAGSFGWFPMVSIGCRWYPMVSGGLQF